MSGADAMDSHGKTDVESPLDCDSAAPAEEHARRLTQSLSLDDIEAAHALENLRADSTQSRSDHLHLHSGTSHVNIDPALRSPTGSATCEKPQEVEPLLSLLTSQHTMLSTAINGSLSAYTSSKTYSPTFKYGAELVEKHIGSPVTSTLTTASRLTGVDSTVRWLYKRPNSGTQEGRLTRRRTTDDNNREDRDVEKGLHDGLPCLERRDSATPVPDILPSYDPGGRSPAYETHDSSTQPRQEPPPLRNHSLPTRVVMTTSGLRAACNEQSLKSLKYCLSWLRWTNDRVGSMTSSLKSTIEEHHASRQEPPTQPSADADGDTQMSSEPRDQSTIIQSMRSLRSGILDGITHVVGIVSTYAGGALPENARKLVRRQILSVPSRFYLLSPSEEGGNPPAQSTPTQSTQTQSSPSQSIQASSAPAPSDVTQRTSAEAERSSAENEIKGAERVVILATEALDMMTQISGIIAGTIHSAENWLDRFGRRQSGEGTNEEPQLAKKQPLDQGATPQIVLDEKEHLKLFEEKEEER